MFLLFFFSLLWIINGVLGIVFGIQINIPRKFKNTEYEKPYRRFISFAHLLAGVPCFVVWILAENKIIAPDKLMVIVAVCIIPAMLYAIIGDMYFRKRLGK